MCGRFTIGISQERMRQHLYENYDIEDFDIELALPRYNVAPGQNVLSVIHDGTKYRAGFLKWGLVPAFAKDEKMGNNMINAKSETLSEKPSFKDSFKNKRCVILGDSFYEWMHQDSSKTPMRIMLTSQGLFPMAGLWSSYTKTDGSRLYTCTIITTKANDTVSPIHDRMPVILTEETKKIWLNPEIKDLSYLSTILVPYDANKMYTYKVSPLVNNPSNECVECINSL
jgi:putative SOS response-associated peptidase YedK